MNNRQKWDNCLELIPKGTMTASKSFLHLGGIEPTFATKSKGPYFWTNENQKILDFACALGPVILGYKNKKVNKAIKQQLKNGISFSLPTELENNLAEEISNIVPNAKKIRFCKNGSDANLCAVRIAQAFTKKKHIATFGYHGFNDHSAITMMPNGIPYWQEYVHKFEYNNLQSLEEILKKHDCSSILMEPVALELPKNNFLGEVRKLANKYEALLIFDEVVSGFRFSLEGCQKIYNVNADLICLGKAMANGMPISAIVGKNEYMSLLENEVMFSLTFGGESLSLAASLATIEQLKKKNYLEFADKGNKLREGIIISAEKHNLKLNFPGNSFRSYLSFDEKEYSQAKKMKSYLNKKMFERNVFLASVIYLTFAHSYNNIAYVLNCIDNIFDDISKNKDKLEIEEDEPFIKRT